MKQNFRGRRFDIQVKKLQGKWGESVYDQRRIVIDPRGGQKKKLDTLIHEALHACLNDLDEDAADETARDIAKFLWRWGWRLQE